MTVEFTPTVGIFGFYSNGNFGDDLMAFLIGQHLKSLDIDLIVFTAEEIYFSKYGFRTEKSIKKFVDSVDVVVIGGGGLIIPRRKRDTYFSKINEQILSLIDRCRENDTPLYAISIGGIGVPIDQIFPVSRQRLITTASYITVRNPQDLPLLQETSTLGSFHHDIVWTTSRSFPPKVQAREAKRIGVNLSAKRLSFAPLRAVLEAVVALRRDCEFIFCDLIRRADGSFGAFRPVSMGHNCSCYSVSEIQKDVDFIRSLDVLLTDHLHISIVAMGYGIPSINFSDDPKVKLLYHNVGLENLLWKKSSLVRLLASFSTKGRLEKLCNRLSSFPKDFYIADAGKHYDVLTRLVHRHALPSAQYPLRNTSTLQRALEPGKRKEPTY